MKYDLLMSFSKYKGSYDYFMAEFPLFLDYSTI